MISPSLAAPPTASVRPASDFEHEVLPHLETLSRVARRMTRHQPAAEDLVQDTLERACRYFWRFQPGTNIRAWLLTIMSNVYISDCRRRTAAPRMVSLDVIDDVSLSHQVAWAAPGGCDVEASTVDRLAEEFILGRIEVLPPHLRAVARLAWVDGLAYQGVALRRQADPAHRVMGAACGRKADAGPANAA
jgi:RNA polymerase sigma-70 factor (ECF subfamily)